MLYVRDLRDKDYNTLRDLDCGDCFIDGSNKLYMKLYTPSREYEINERKECYCRIVCLTTGVVSWEYELTPCVKINVVMNMYRVGTEVVDDETGEIIFEKE